VRCPLDVALQRILAACFVRAIGPKELEDRALEFAAGRLDEAEAATVMADLDRIAGMLIPG
jgi:hypothetical protein